MESLEFAVLAVSAVFVSFTRFKITSFPVIFGIVGSNVLIVNLIGSFVIL